MFYPKADFCPFNCDKPNEQPDNPAQTNSETNAYYKDKNSMDFSQCEMMRQIQEIDFAIIDLNLFLDTHPNCIEALELFSELAHKSKNLKKEYQVKYGPLYAPESQGKAPFEWIDKCRKGTWEM